MTKSTLISLFRNRSTTQENNPLSDDWSGATNLQRHYSSEWILVAGDTSPRVPLGQARITSPVRRRVLESSGQLLHANDCSKEMNGLSNQ